jgi:hypothetical protein
LIRAISGILPDHLDIVQSVQSVSVDDRKFSVDTLVVLELIVPEENPVFMKVCCIIYVGECWMLCGPVLCPKQYLAHFILFRLMTPELTCGLWTAVKTARPVFVSGIEVFSHNDKQLVVLSYKLVHTAN